MAMLAEPRRKQKWTLNPRGKLWSDDTNKFGQKMLEKMGWTSGKGLGANLDGMTEHIRARYKNDQGGIGFSNDFVEKQWTQHQEGYNELLQKLQNGEPAEACTKDNELSGKSLELKSKQSRARLHYQKFTRGKDVNKYSTKDLANIFGKKDVDEKLEALEPENLEVKRESEESFVEPVGSSDTSHGVVTIKGGSITDYFKNKMPSLVRKTVNDDANDDKNDTESEGERYAGFGLARTQMRTEKSTGARNYTFENPALDTSSPREISVTPGKRKNDYVFENRALEIGDSPREIERTPKRRRKSEFAFENGGLELESLECDETKPNGSVKTKKMSFSRSTETSEEAAKCEETSINVEPVESIGKKKRKKKSKERCSVIGEGFTNEALNLEIREDEESANVGQFEIPRLRFGLANDALDLSDESSGKKRVTFNETIEYETERAGGKKRNKNAGKLDKFEVDNEKLKKKRKKKKGSSTEVVTIDGASFVNEAMNVEIISQEANDNAANERKIERARRKLERRMSNLETIEEAPEEEKESPVIMEVVTLDESLVGEASEDLQVLSLDTPKRKRKKKRKDEKISQEHDNSVRTIDENVKDVEFIEEMSSTEVDDDKTSKGEVRTKEDCVESMVVVDMENSGKRKKKRKKEVVSGEAKVIEVIEEIDENVEVTREEKKKKRMKDQPRDNIDKENVEVISENTEIFESEKKRKKPKKKKTSSEREESDEIKRVSSGEILSKEPEVVRDNRTELQWNDETANHHAEMQNGLRSPWDSKAKKSKILFKTLFARSPVVHFPGSNINEIKGYGMDIN